VTTRSRARRSEEDLIPDGPRSKKAKSDGVKDSKNDKAVQEEDTAHASGEGSAPKLKSTLKKKKKVKHRVSPF